MNLIKYLGWAIIVGLFAIVLITPFFVSESMFFPFITGKNFLFRIIVEIIFALWIILAMADSRYRPKASPILWAACSVVGVLILSTIFGVNPYRSFWSNFERMEGLISHLHLLAYFLVLISMFKSSIQWRRFFYAISASGAAMALYGYFQALGILTISVQSGPRADGSFGNASYMAIFILLNVFFASYLFFTEERKWLKNIFAGLVVFEIPVVFLTATRGAILGLIGGFFLLALLLAFFSKDKRFRWASIGVIGGVILLVLIFLSVKNTDFVRNNYVFQRFGDLSFAERTIQSRFIIWKMSFEGFKERPIFGWGIENFGQVFNKYYEPALWLQEPWFDRAHNVIFDWLVSSGIIGLLAYLSLFGSAIYIIWKKSELGSELDSEPSSESESAKLITAVVFTSLLAAYFFNNFFIFDNLTSYILFFSVLAFIHFYTNSVRNPIPNRVRTWTSGPLHSFLVAFIILGLIFSLYFLNIKPILANTWLLQALKDTNFQGQNIDLVLSDFENVFNLRTFGTGEAREQLSTYANAVFGSVLPQKLKDKVTQVSINELERQTRDNPEDPRGYLFLSSMYTNAGRHEDALRAVERALELSPNKQQILFLLAETHLNLGGVKRAYDLVKIAYESAPEYQKAVQNFATMSIINGLSDEAEKALIKFFGTALVADQQLVNAYARVGNYERVRDIWLEFIRKDPQNVQYHINLAATYMELGERREAINEIEKAIELNPQFKDQGRALINEINAGRNPVSR